MTLEELNEEVQIAIQKAVLLIKETHQVGQQLVEKAKTCEASEEDVSLCLMTYVAAIRQLESTLNVS